MTRRFHCFALGAALAPFALSASAEQRVTPESAVSLLQSMCADCHGEQKQKGKFALHDIDPDISGGMDIERWEKILEMVSIGDMPPEDEAQPTSAQRDLLLNWVGDELQKIGRGPDRAREAFPQHGNRVDHDDLFSGEHEGPSFTQPRVWRISSAIYERFSKDTNLSKALTAPLQDASAHGIRDYAVLYADEATIMTMLQNSKLIATTLIEGPLVMPKRNKQKKVDPYRKQTQHRPFAEFIAAGGEPGEREMKRVVSYAFEFLLHRAPSQEDLATHIDGLLKPNAARSGRKLALQGTLVAIMLSPEFLFRMELGLGETLPDGRRMLSPREIAYSLSFAVFDYIDPTLLKAAESGNLSTKEDIAREFRRVLDSPDKKVRRAANKKFWAVDKAGSKSLSPSHPRLLRFFREFFGYTRAPDVFKDDTRHDGKHDGWLLVRDADWFVLRVLKDDRQVLEELLTSRQYFIRYTNTRPAGDITAYNLTKDDWEKDKTFEMPAEQRSGILTHPAWLAAFSGNFENDPVRRGRWIQEHLLAGIVPDIPIGVAAQLPEEPERTLRERFDVVRKEECWRCHKKMNPLGDPFEAYDDFGRFRREHLIGEDGHVIASEFEAHSRLRKNQWRSAHKKGAPLENFKKRPVDSSGVLAGTGDPALDGEIDGATDLLARLAKSDRVRQSFIRHVFRYWTGRNETLDDSPSLMAMEKAYVDNGGSFREVLVALVTSDSFLYRK